MKFKKAQKFTLKNQTLYLLPQKAVFWDEQRMLIVSDVHLGKSGHFSKHGIAVPKTVNQSNIGRLDKLVQSLNPQQILFLGDLFHSQHNDEFGHFIEWRNQYASIEMILTLGNHDILKRFELERMGLNCVNRYSSRPFIFRHDESNNKDSKFYSISGHVHPTVKLRSKGRQNLYLPCFYFGKHDGLIPAFGTFTGNYRIKPAQNDSVYAVVENKVIDISSIISPD
jgi:DNA ligase-associated metallophosphoesterase